MKMFTKLLLTTITIVWFLKLTGANSWDATLFNNDYNENGKILEKKPSITLKRYCNDADGCSDDDTDTNLTPNEIDKRNNHNHKHVSLESIPMDDRTFSYFPQFHHRTAKFCSCGHEKRLADLGSNYFPRYISDMVCIPGGCDKNHTCRPKRFKLWVMRKRQEDEEPGAEPIPKELREYWVGESVVTTIDCECAP